MIQNLKLGAIKQKVKLQKSSPANMVMKLKKELPKQIQKKSGFNSGSIWKLEKKMFQKSREPPTAMVDNNVFLQPEEHCI